MNTIKNIKQLSFLMLFGICFMIVTSCDKKIEQPQKEVYKNTKVSELLLTQIAESNLKIVAIAQKAQEIKMQKSTKTILQEVENNHTQLKNNIKKIAKNNFIIIPNTLYDTTTLKNFISEKNISLYLEKLLSSLVAELELYKTIDTTQHNKDLKFLINQAIPSIKKDLEIVNKELKKYQ